MSIVRTGSKFGLAVFVALALIIPVVGGSPAGAATLSYVCDDDVGITVTVPDSRATEVDWDSECKNQGHVGAVATMGGCDNKASLFGISAWYKGMSTGLGCTFEPLKDSSGRTDIAKTAMKIGLNVLQALMTVAGYVALIFLIIGGFRYMTAAGSPDETSNAKKTITNAIIGLVVALLAAAIVSAIAGMIK